MVVDSSTFLINKERDNAHMTCACGSEELHLYIFDDSDECLFLTLYTQPIHSLRARIAAAWRALTNKNHTDSVILNKKSVTDMRDWLTEIINNGSK